MYRLRQQAARRFGMVHHPGGRKNHDHPTPLGGGRAICRAFRIVNALAGAIAAHTILPVIGVPLPGSPLQGLDALLSTVQMPPGVPVATVSVNELPRPGELSTTMSPPRT